MVKVKLDIQVEVEADITRPEDILRTFQTYFESTRTSCMRINEANMKMTLVDPQPVMTRWNGEEWVRWNGREWVAE